MTSEELKNKYFPKVQEILKGQWFNIFLGHNTLSMIKLDGEINAPQMRALADICEKIDEEKKKIK